MLRLNVAIPPTTKGPSNLGLIGGDPAGFPNGRRVFDDVATIEIRAIAGATLPLVDPSFKADAGRPGARLHGADLGSHRPHRHGHRELPHRSSPTSGSPTRGSPPTPRRSDRWTRHRHSPRDAVPPSGEGTVVLDIGGGRGAAVLFTPASLAGEETRDQTDGRALGRHPHRRPATGPAGRRRASPPCSAPWPPAVTRCGYGAPRPVPCSTSWCPMGPSSSAGGLTTAPRPGRPSGPGRRARPGRRPPHRRPTHRRRAPTWPT